jgi:hypothetical protein
MSYGIKLEVNAVDGVATAESPWNEAIEKVPEDRELAITVVSPRANLGK